MSLPKCNTKFCRGRCLPSGKSCYCSKCRTRNWRDRHPVEYTFAKIRSRAKERGHAFTLTIDEFREFVARTDYMQRKGKTGASLSIDRIRNEEGYHRDNIRVLTLSENATRLRKAPEHVAAQYQF
jgi:hypothetical protein